MILGDKIIDLRKKAGWSQEQLAEELGVSRQAVSKWESGMSVPDLDKVLALSTLFGVSTDYLLKEALELPEPAAGQDREDPRSLSAEEANAYLALTEQLSVPMGRAVAALICSPIPLVMLGALSERWPARITEDLAGGLGVALLLGLVLLGVLPLIRCGLWLEPYEYLEREPIALQYGVAGIVEKRLAARQERYRQAITTGVGLCIGGVIPMMLGAAFGAGDLLLSGTVCLLLASIAGAVFLIVREETVRESCHKLLQRGDYSPEEKVAGKRLAWFPGAWWCTVTAVFLALSLYSGSWDRTWIIWPVAGVLFVALYTVLKAAIHRK